MEGNNNGRLEEWKKEKREEGIESGPARGKIIILSVIIKTKSSQHEDDKYNVIHPRPLHPTLDG